METVFEALNRLVADGVIRNYAIGGAVGASFYIDALMTEDIDAFVFLKEASSGIVMLSPVYEALKAMGGVVDREYMRFGEWPLQILTDADALIREAIESAMDVDYGSTRVRVFRAEYLCGIALQTGRGKDLLRVDSFLEQRKVESEALADVVKRFGLEAQLAKVERLHD